MNLLAIGSMLPKTGEGWAAAITAVCTLITTIWLKVDAMRVKKDVKVVGQKVDTAAATAKETTEVVAQQTKAAAEVVVQHSEAAKAEVVAKIEENTAVNVQAIKESNNYNQKIADGAAETKRVAAALGQRIDDLELKHEQRHNELKSLIESIKPAA